MDVDAIRLAIHEITADGIARGASAVRKDGRAFIIQQGRVVTVYPRGAWLEHVKKHKQ